jgi:hypothetical protein
MTSSQAEISAMANAAVTVVIPLRKPGSIFENDWLEGKKFYGRTCLEWAVEEALFAGATKVIFVLPVLKSDAARKILGYSRVIKRCFLLANQQSGVRSVPASWSLIRCPFDNLSQVSWDFIVSEVCKTCDHGEVIVLDPSIILMVDGKVSTHVTFLLKRHERLQASNLSETEASLRRGALAVAYAEWETALPLPIISDAADDVKLLLERPHDSEKPLVFLGRALVQPSMFVNSLSICSEDLLPFEELILQSFMRPCVILRVNATPIDLRFHAESTFSMTYPASLGNWQRSGLGVLSSLA